MHLTIIPRPGTISRDILVFEKSCTVLTVPESLKTNVDEIRGEVAERFAEIISGRIGMYSALLLCNENGEGSFYVVFYDEPMKIGYASITGKELPISRMLISSIDKEFGVVVADEIAFTDEGAPASISDITSNPQDYYYKLVKIDARLREISVKLVAEGHENATVGVL